MRRIILWTCPRCVSTAFERCFIGIAGIRIFHEPYGNPFYFGDECLHSRFVPVQKAVEINTYCDPNQSEVSISNTHQDQKVVSSHLPATEPVLCHPIDGDDIKLTYKEVLDMLLSDFPDHSVVFSKDMAYYLRGRMTSQFLSGFTHTFLIRHPCITALSFWSKSRCESDGKPNKSTGWTYFDVEELGFIELYELAKLVSNNFDDEPLIIDADDLLLSPSKMLHAYCTATGLPFSEDMLTWDARPMPAWNVWPGWHDDALKSTGLVQRAHKKSPPLVSDVIEFMRADTKHCPSTCDDLHNYDWDHITAVLERSVRSYKELYDMALKVTT
eukprot:gene2491-5421_t